MDSGLRRNDEVKNLEPSFECQHNLVMFREIMGKPPCDFRIRLGNAAFACFTVIAKNPNMWNATELQSLKNNYYRYLFVV